MIASFSSPFVAQPTPLQHLQGEWLQWDTPVFMKREECRDALLGGNKWCKLQGWLAAAQAQGIRRLVSVGGRWSNHLHALAHAGQRFGFETIGLVRGEDLDTATMHDAAAAGMSLQLLSREAYRQRNEKQWQQEIEARFSPCLFIPEGGFGEQAQLGLSVLAAELVQQMEPHQGEICFALPVGSGTTLLGLRKALPSRFHVVGFQVYADAGLAQRLTAQLGVSSERNGWQLENAPAMRQHRVLSADLQQVMTQFQQQHHILLDPIYTVRLMKGLQAWLLERQRCFAGVVALHTGGLQGRRGHAMAMAA